MNHVTQPYHTDSLNVIYNLLFCDDMALFQKNINDQSLYPWNILFSSQAKKEELISITDNEASESRVRILASNKLRAQGNTLEYQELLGIIVEVAMDEGLDVIAAYSD